MFSRATVILKTWKKVERKKIERKSPNKRDKHYLDRNNRFAPL